MTSNLNKKDELTSLPNIGKVTADKLKQIGINTTKDFLKRDPYQVFTELLVRVDPTLCRCALASLVGAKLGVTWHKITNETTQKYESLYPAHKWPKC